MYFVYIIKNQENQLYVGVSEDPEKRLQTHNTKQGALFTKNKGEFAIVFLEEYPILNEARQREIQIKKWRREKKEVLIKLYEQGVATKIPKEFFGNFV